MHAQTCYTTSPGTDGPADEPGHEVGGGGRAGWLVGVVVWMAAGVKKNKK